MPTPNAGEAARAPHQRWSQFGTQPGRREHEFVARPALHTFHSDYSPTYIWGFNGRYPAETILNNYNRTTIVRFRNNLPDELTHTGFGKPEITIHLHNGHHGSESDGFAGDFFGTGLWKDNLYPNIYAGVRCVPAGRRPARSHALVLVPRSPCRLHRAQQLPRL